MDGIRAVAVLVVVLYHATVQHLLPVLQFPGGYIGVDIFFVLSGFVITTVLARGGRDLGLRDRYRKFITNRVKRLYPALAGALVAVLLAVSLGWRPAGTDSIEAGARWTAIAASQMSSFVVAAEHGPPNVVGPTWTLSIEWMFYLMWPLVVWGICRLRRPDLVTGALTVLTYALSLLIDPQYWWALPPGRFAQLMAGATLALYTIRGDRSSNASAARGPAWGCWIALFAIYLWSSAIGEGPAYPTFRLVGAPMMTVVALALIRGGSRPGTIRAFLECRPMAAVGRASYSLYLVHVPWMFVFATTIGADKKASWSTALLTCAAIAATTMISFRWLEAPYLRKHSRSDLIETTAGTA